MNSIRWKFLTAMISMILSLLIFLTFLQINAQKDILEDELSIRIELMKKNLFERANSQLESLNVQVQNAIATVNFLRIINLSNELVKKHQELIYIILMDQEGKAVIHTRRPDLLETKLLQAEDNFALAQTSTASHEFHKDGNHYIEFITPITISSSPWGILRLGYSLNELNREVDTSRAKIAVRTKQMIKDAILTTFVFVLLGSIIMLVLSAKLSKPLIRLTKSAQLLAKGDFSATKNLVVESNDEVGLLSCTFIQMSKDLQNSYEKLEDYSKTLEQKVEERTIDLQQAYKDLKDSQEQLVQSEKMAALGQLVAGVAHEINTPLGAIKSSISSIGNALEYTIEHYPVVFNQLTMDEKQSFLTMVQQSSSNQVMLSMKQKRHAKKSLKLQLDKLEIPNSRKYADYFANFGLLDNIEPFMPLLNHTENELIFATGNKISNIQRGIKNIMVAVERASKVVFALKKFAHHDQIGEKIPADINDSLETVLTIYHNQIKQGFELIREYGELPEIYCYPDELHQVWVNLIHNALQAMSSTGILTIKTTTEDKYAMISISDTGQGISEENMQRIFQPFFTTKAAGEGSGLGLDIVKKIIDKHNGEISVNSIVGAGTTVTVKLNLTDH